MRRYVQITFILLSFTLLCACDGFNKLAKSTDYEAQYKAAVQYYNEGSYTKAKQLFESLQLHYRNKDNAEDMAWYYSQVLFKEEEYYTASYNFLTFEKKYPYSPRAEEALFLSAYCEYKESPESSLDQTLTKAAISDFELFAEKYPSSSHIPEVNAYLDEMNKKLMQKDYDIAVGYYKTESYHAAYVALKNFLNYYPDSPNREDAMYYIIRSGYEYAINSREDKVKERLELVINDFDKFAVMFSNSKYMSASQSIYTKSKAMLAKLDSAK